MTPAPAGSSRPARGRNPRCRCGGWARSGQATCKTCHAAYMRDYRQEHRRSCDDCREAQRVLDLANRAVSRDTPQAQRHPQWRKRLWPLALAALTLLATCAQAHGEPVVFHAWTGRQHAFTGEGSVNEWVGGVGVRGPVAGTPMAVLVDLQLGALPDQRLQLADPDTWSQAADLRLALAWPLATRVEGGQWVTLEAVAAWGFYTALQAPSGGAGYSRAWGGGVRLAERRAGAFLEVLVGRLQACGPPGRGQLLLRGSFPLVRGPLGLQVALVGDAGLNLLAPTPEPGRRDILRLAVAVAAR